MSMIQNLQLPRVQYDLLRLSGGLDQVTPTLSLKPGVVRRAANFECSITGGYTRIAGYERFDGRPAPSDAVYFVLSVNLTTTVAVGATVVGMTSLAEGKVIALIDGGLILTRQTGDFDVDESIKVGLTTVGTVTDVLGQVADGQDDAEYRALAADDYRADIAVVPGSGPVRGVAFFDGDVYAWRNNTGGTGLGMFKATTSGWSGVSYFATFDFDSGSSEFFAGDTIVGHSSGATALIKAVVLQSGSWSAGNAAGYAVFTNMTGTPTTNELIYVGGTKRARYQGAYSAIAPLPNGRVQYVVANFGGGQLNKKMYFCDGVNQAYEFDGETLVPIRTGMSPDAPTRIVAHKQHLFLAFQHSLQFSSLGDPLLWDPVQGAGEIALNSPVTNLIALPGDQSSGALAVYTDNETSVLYGSSEADFRLSNFNTGAGARAYTAQNMEQTYALAERGVMGMGTTLNFGNFLSASLTMNIRPFIQARRNLASASVVNREKGQYRLFFNDGKGVYLTILNGSYMGAMPVEFPNAVLCTTEGGNVDGPEISYFGSDNGFVYALDAGTSFDGEDIPANITLVYNSTNSPRILKRFRRASVEMTGDSYAEFSFAYDLGYRTPELEQPLEDNYRNDLRPAYWDAISFDNFVFDGRDISPSEVEVVGTAENMAIRLSSVSGILKPFTINSIIVHYTMRRGLR
jgi:hypothetical protein